MTAALFKKKGNFFNNGKCPECSHQKFFIGPNNGVAYNIKCKSCGTYLLVIPAKKKAEVIHPDRPW